jgi:dinuclear metal center YbgI/SA1388 family protein
LSNYFRFKTLIVLLLEELVVIKKTDKMPRIKDFIAVLEAFAPLSYQESYDNCGLLTGNANEDCTGVICTLDCTEDVVQEAINNNSNLIVAHHPIIFGGLKKITGKNYVERTVIKAIKNDIAIYAIHTNADNVINGVNKTMADKIGLVNCNILAPKIGLLSKFYVYVPLANVEAVREAIFAAGAGEISNYSECSFATEGVGSFKGNNESNAFVGEKNLRHYEKEVKLEVILPNYLQNQVLEAVKKVHPYEEVAYELISLNNLNQQIGSGMIGSLAAEISEIDFLSLLAQQFGNKAIKHTSFLSKPINKVAICGGSGGFLLKNAIASQADVFVTSDLKYHEFFDAENKILVVDLGHYETEQFTPNLLMDVLQQNFPTFAAIKKSGVNTNPVDVFVH